MLETPNVGLMAFCFHSQEDLAWEVHDFLKLENVLHAELDWGVLPVMLGPLCHPLKLVVIHKLSYCIIIGAIYSWVHGCFSYQEGKSEKHSALHMNLFYLLLIIYIQVFWQRESVFFPHYFPLDGCWHVLKSYFYFARGLFENCESTAGLTYGDQKPRISEAE